MQKVRTTMKTIWFRPWGWFYRPVAPSGWVACLVATVFGARVFVAVDPHAHSAVDTLYGFFPYRAAAFLLLNQLARRSCSSTAE